MLNEYLRGLLNLSAKYKVDIFIHLYISLRRNPISPCTVHFHFTFFVWENILCENTKIFASADQWK